MRKRHDIFSKSKKAGIGHPLEEETTAESAPLLVEYGILVGLITVVAFGAVLSLGTEVQETLQSVSKMTQMR